MAAPKKYGLIIPKSKQQAIKKPAFKPSAAFGGDSDEEDPSAVKKAINRALLQEGGKKATNRAAQVVMSRALEQDPTVYQYDEVYDKMADDRHCVADKKKTKDRKPKYVHQLLKNAASRKLDDERRMERQAHREREKEGDEFGDKDAYITPSFLKKQAELKEAEEAARRKEAAEDANDVTKKGNLNDFYRNLLSRKTSAGGQFTEQEAAKEEAAKRKPAAVSTAAAGDVATAAASGQDVRKDDDEDDRDDDDKDDGDDRNASGSDSSESEVEAEEIAAAMELVKSKSDREAEEILARKRALDALQQQRAAAARHAEEDTAAKLNRRNDDTSITSARERYLQRKREQAAKDTGPAAGAGGGGQ